MAACLLILLFVRDELSYDRYNQEAHRIFRVAAYVRFGGMDKNVGLLPAPLAAACLREFPEVEQAVRFREQGNFIVRHADRSFTESRLIFADASVFQVFTLPLRRGDPRTALRRAAHDHDQRNDGGQVLRRVRSRRPDTAPGQPEGLPGQRRLPRHPGQLAFPLRPDRLTGIPGREPGSTSGATSISSPTCCCVREATQPPCRPSSRTSFAPRWGPGSSRPLAAPTMSCSPPGPGWNICCSR